MSHPKTLHVGAGVLTRYRNGACAFTCRHSGCRAYSEPRSWRAGLRQASRHAADHELPPTRRRRGRFAVLLVVLLLLAISSAGTYLAVEVFTTRATTIEGVR